MSEWSAKNALESVFLGSKKDLTYGHLEKSNTFDSKYYCALLYHMNEETREKRSNLTKKKNSLSR